MLRWPTLLYNTCLQHSSQTLTYNTSLQHFSAELFYNSLLQHSSPTLLFKNLLQHFPTTMFPNTLLHHFPTTLFSTTLLYTSPALLYNTLLQHSFTTSKERWLKQCGTFGKKFFSWLRKSRNQNSVNSRWVNFDVDFQIPFSVDMRFHSQTQSCFCSNR